MDKELQFPTSTRAQHLLSRHGVVVPQGGFGQEITWIRVLKDAEKFPDINIGWRKGEKPFRAEGMTCTKRLVMKHHSHFKDEEDKLKGK